MKKIYYIVDKCLGCKSCEIACAIGKSQSKELLKAIFEQPKPNPCVDVKKAEGKNFPIACRHCEKHPCVDACIAAALTFNKEKGNVEHNKDKCVGCWMCIMVCPYGAIRQNNTLKIPIRCDRCQDVEVPRCVQACSTKAIVYEEQIESRQTQR